jgi:hypothetical protein
MAPCLSASTPAAAQTNAPSHTATAQDIYVAACITCHGADGKGSSRTVVGFDVPLPDFTDCGFTTAEPDQDWFAVVHEGGPIRGLDRHMPSFGRALSRDEMGLAISHVRTFCTEPSWPRGDLNFPRSFFTEKAFPENEAVWATTFTRGADRAIGNELIYERRIGVRNQIEINAPVELARGASGAWTRGIGDIALAFKRTLYSSVDRGRIAAAGLEVILPTGDRARGFGKGLTIIEPFAMWGQALPKNSFLQMHGGAELPSDTTRGTRELYLRTAVGTTIAQNRGFGRAWSPQLEVLWARPQAAPAEWDVVPQVQVTLSKLQHVMIAGGVRIPLTQRDERHPQALIYLVWDWFDGGFLEFWK